MSRSFAGVVLSRPRETFLWTALLFAYYLLTMSRGLSMYDSPELAMVAGQLGLGHPTGQPVHTVLGFFAASLGSLVGIDERVSLNALSAAAGALCLVPAVSLAEAVLADGSPARSVDRRIVTPALALLGVHTALWEPATRIEVYSLACLFSLWAIACCAHALRETTEQPRRFLIVGLCVGLSTATHPHFGFATALALAPRILLGLARREIQARSLLATLLGGPLGLLPYLYVPWVARRQGVFVWGHPTDLESLVRYFTGAEFSHNREITMTAWLEHLELWLDWALDSRVLLLLATGLIGNYLFCKRRVLGRLPFNLLLIYFVALVTSNTRFAPDVLDYLEYLAIVSWLAAVGTALLLAHIWSLKKLGGMGVAVVLALFLLAPARSSFLRTRHLDRVTDDIATEALTRAPENAILIVERDHWVAPLWYLQRRNGMRPDVVVLAYGLSGSTWYWESLLRSHPSLQPIELRAPGGKRARIQRFLQQHRDRPLQIERVDLARQLGVQACPSDWLLDVRSRCPAFSTPSALPLYIEHSLNELRDGSLGTDGLLAMMAFDRGYDLWALGWPRAAVRTLLAGVPEDLAPTDTLDAIPERGNPTWAPAPAYEPPVALGHPARNLHLASVIANAAGAKDLAERLRALSREAGPATPKIHASR